jgi:hypothetical protein
MATILQPQIQFTGSFQLGVEVSFKVKFTGIELAGGVSPLWKKIHPNFFPSQLPPPPQLPPPYTYSAQVLLKVIRAIPQPFLKGDPPPPLPDPFTLQVKTLPVSLLGAGNVKSLSIQFTYALGLNNSLISDHFHAEILLFRRLKILPTVFSFVIDSKITNPLDLTVSDLANPQPDGTVIP